MAVATSGPEPFTIDVPEADLLDLRRRLASTRWPHDFANDDWSYGANTAYLAELVDHWRDGYDWRRHEAAMNEFDHFRATVDGISIHVMHRSGRGRRRVPVLLLHGWPWSFWDYRDVAARLADPASYGLDDSLAFDVYVPSLPGFGFSGPLRESVSRERMADLFQVLMCEILGHERFVVHGGDAGAFVSAFLAHGHASSLIGCHLSFPAFLDWRTMARLVPEAYAPEEAGWHERWTTKMRTATAHTVVHRTSPQSLGIAFNDSPAGLAAWLVERRRNWSDCDGDLESVFSRDDVLTLVSLYWLTGSVHTSMRHYADSPVDGWTPRHNRTPVLEAPTAMAVFPGELILAPRAVFAETADLRRWTVMARGGHFAAAEQPEAVADDIRAFVASL